MKRLTVGILVFCSALLVSSAARAQSGTGAVAGTARDASGAVMPGATVEAASPALIEKVRTAITDADGTYRIIDLRPGTYTVTFTLQGFSTFKREGIEVTTGVTSTVNAELKVGALEETITVTGASPVVDVQNTRNQAVLSHDLLESLPASRTNQGFAQLTLGAASVAGGAVVLDQGGSKGDSTQRLTVHGMRGNDQRMLYDGMNQNNLNSNGSGKNWQTNQIAVQEVVVGTATASSEIETSGMTINYVPREGGNSWSFTFQGSGTSERFQADNLDSQITATGVTSAQSVKRVYDIGFGLGGPIVKDKLWFFNSFRYWGSEEYQPDSYYNKSTSPYTFVADLDRRGHLDHPARDNATRITWQAAAKHKVNFSYTIQKSCQCHLGLSANTSPESTPRVETWPGQQPIVSWSYAKSNRLLFEGAVSYLYLPYKIVRDELFPGGIRVQELSTGKIFTGSSQSPFAALDSPSVRQNNVNQRFSMSYVGGSHAVKVGQQYLDGWYDQTATVSQSLWYSFLNGRPSTLTQFAVPVTWHDRVRSFNLFAQDQWTLSKLTLNLGVRYDAFRGWVPAGTRDASPFTPSFSYDKVENVPNFKDVSPRIGAAYDVFGNGKTAIKGAIGRYMSSMGSELPDANNPALAIVTSATRAWGDTDLDFVPDCDLTNLNANGECQAVNNRQFGLPFRNTFYDDSAVRGTNRRSYNWQANLSLQQELSPGIAFTAGYFRTTYKNFTVTQNSLVAPADFSSYCVTAPTDARLEGASGQRLCGLFDVSTTKFGQVSNLVTAVSNFGEMKEQFDGVDLNLNARLGRGGVVQGGVSFGRLQVDNCYLKDRPDLGGVNTTTNFTSFAPPAAATQSRTDEFCRISPPWSAGTQLKGSGYFPLPWWGLVPSFSIQNLPGAQILANQAIPNAAIAPSLGRSLSACPATGNCTATVTVALIPPQTMFLDRVTAFDLALAKVFNIAGWRAKGMFNLYNVFNTSTVLNVNGTYGAAWLRPTSIIGGRLAKFGVQLDF